LRKLRRFFWFPKSPVRDGQSAAVTTTEKKQKIGA
jgi:hypothetical protein